MLMVLDHALVLVQFVSPAHVEWAYLLRMTVTRASLPLFGICSGVLMHRAPSLGRYGNIVAVAAVVNVALVELPMGVRPPEILAVWALVVWSCGWLVRSRPALALVLGVLQVTVWPIGWHGYEPGVVLVYLALGFLAGWPVLAWGGSLPSWLERVGSRPLRWYVGHLAVLMLVSVLV